MNFHHVTGTVASNPKGQYNGLTKTLRVMTSRITESGSRSHRPFKKIFLAMNLTATISLVFALQLSAKTYSQTVTYSGKNVTLETVFSVIEKQTGYVVFFSKSQLKEAKRVTIDAHSMPLDQLMEIILKDQSITYHIEDKTIMLAKKKVETSPSAGDSSLSISETSPADIHGRVTDSTGAPLGGASITVKGSRKGTQTDGNGYFDLKGIKDNAILVVSFTGYRSTEYKISGQGDISIAMKRSNSPLDEIQVIAYGTTTDRFTTGNVTTVTAKEIEQQPVSNPLLALQGRVPGLFITQATGMPGSGITVRIQGQNSIFNGNDPFYVIDGVPYSSKPLQSMSPAGLNANNQAGNPMDLINPSDIESISVLKDADATAIYGSRAANGAILVTTKKGKIGETKFDLNLQTGWGGTTRRLQVLNTTEYLAMRHEAISNDGLTVQPTDYDINGVWDTTKNTDWQKELLGGDAQFTSLNASLSGGNSVTQYFVGATYNRQKTAFSGNFSDQKGSMHFNISTASTNKKFRMQFNGSYLLDDNELPGTDLTQTALQLAPDAPQLLNKDGSINWALDQNGNSTWVNGNPLASTLNRYENKNNNLISNATLSYQLLPGLELKSNFGYNSTTANEIAIYPLTAHAPADRPYNSRASAFTFNNSNSWIIEPQADYRKSFGQLKMESLVGATLEQNKTNNLSLNAFGFNSDLVLQDLRSASTVAVGTTAAPVYKYNAGFGRINFNWADKYLLNLTGRRDGSSRFGPANEFHDFWSVGGGWIFSKEKIIQDAMEFLSFGKLKGSYGTTGSDQIGDYQFLSLYSPYGGLPYQGMVPLTPNGLTNPYLQWEETRKMEFGVDLGFIKDRILISGTYVRNRSSNELLSYNLPSITGGTAATKNFPATIENEGLEFTVNTVNIKSRNFGWSIHFNLTIPRNKLVAFPDLVSSGYSNYYTIGQPISGLNKVFHFLGVNDTTGVYQFASKAGPTSNPESGVDNTVIVNTNPKFYGGITNNFTWKGFELDVLFQFVKQTGGNYSFGNYPAAIYRGNQPTYVLDRWQKQGDIKPIQRYTTQFNYFNQWFNAASSSDAGYSDASFIRLKNLAISYQLPAAWSKKAGLQAFKLYVHAQNLLTITHYKGMDPENPSGRFAGLPPIREITGGIQATF